jgi:hypothetical protein
MKRSRLHPLASGVASRDRWRSNQRFGPSLAVAEAPDIFNKYAWTLAYDSKDLSSTTWPASSLGAQSITLSANAAATENVSTGALLAGGIGASRVNRAIICEQTQGAFASSDTLSTDNSFTLPAGPLHARILVRKASDITANGYLFRWLDTSSIFIEAYHVSSERVTARIKDGTPDFSVNGPALSTAETWSLVDILYEPTGGAGGFARTSIWTNGTLSTADDTEVVDPFGNTGGISVCGNGKLADISRGAFVFVGLRFGVTFTEAEHDADCALIGV